MKKRYCIHCNQEVSYNVVEKMTTKIIRGKNVSYMSKSAICPNCSKEIYVPEISDRNLERKIAAYKKNEDIISVSEINTILEMYRIGKRPLSKMLGFGEITITRFLNGKVPSKKSSDILKNVLISTEKMREYAQNNTDETLNSACLKVLEAIDGIEHLKNAPKIERIAQYFLIHLEGTTNMCLNKLLHFSQVFNFMIYGEPLFLCESEAWVHGPVYRTIYQKYKRCNNCAISPIIKDDKILNLTQKETKILDEIIVHFGCYSAITLRNMTHVENIWRDAREGLAENQISNNPIKLSDVGIYAQELKKILEIKLVNDSSIYSSHLRKCDLNKTPSIIEQNA